MKKIKVIFLLVIVTLVLAACSKVEYLVVYDTDGGTTIANEYVVEGQKLQEPADPKKDGYKFEYWLLDGERFDFKTPINSNIRLVAKWEVEQVFYTITIDTDGALGNKEVQVKEGDKVSKPEDPVKDGYLFIEWQVDGKSYDFNQAVTKNFTIKALWEEEYTSNIVVASMIIISDKYPEGIESEYYFEREEDYQIVITLINHDQQLIESVSINNISYNKSEFAIGSNKEIIILDFNTRNDFGIHLISLDHLEVVTEQGNKTLKINDVDLLLYVKARFEPVIYYEDEIPGFNEHQLSFDVVDRNNLINYQNDGALFYLYEEDVEVNVIKMDINLNIINLTNLKFEKEYTYKIIAKYDLYDGLGEITKTLHEGSFKTLPPFEVKTIGEEEKKINFKINMLVDVTLNSIEFYQGNLKIRNVDLLDTLIEGLEPDIVYTFRFDYTYELNGETINQKQSFDVKTYKLIMEDVIRNGRVVKHPNGTVVQIPTYKKKAEEVRGIWVSTVSNIDIPKIQGSNIEGYKDTIRLMLDNIENANFNTVFFQIRPMNDAFYPSQLAPWSRYITGTEGKNPGFDVLEFVIAEAHARGLELHGWLNPYRVATNQGMLSGMDNNNFAKKHPELLLTDSDGAVILDPGKPEVQTYIRAVINEIITNYPTINGVHFDDYFYLSTFGEDSSSPDYQTYLSYRLNSTQSMADFRRMSVTKMIRGIYEDVEAFNAQKSTHVKFGISPSGVWANKSAATPDGSDTRGYQHYSALYADTKAWINEGIIHYIIPQIYWDFTLTAAPYGHLVDWWSNVVKNTDVVLLIGMGLYRYRESSWYTYEIAEQLRYNQNHDEVKGQVFFTYQDIVSTQYEQLKIVRDFIFSNYWTDKAITPW